MLYRAFGWEPPQFAHLPLILKPIGKGKLSKRDGDKLGFPVFPLLWTDPKTKQVSAGYREDGYFPDAVVNMLALLGWNEGNDKEIYSISEMIEAFSLDRVSKSGAKFDPQKTQWFNSEYLRQRSNSELLDAFRPILSSQSSHSYSDTYVLQVIDRIKERATFVSDIWTEGSFYFTAPQQFDAKASKKQWKATTPDLMNELIERLIMAPSFDSEPLAKFIKDWITERGVGFGKVMQPFRLSLVGAPKGPDIFDIASMLGRDETVARLRFAVQTLPNP